ncbi:hypothetical protein A2W48_00870 [Candidatus Giovannonibacteria bacterium RIFCSPHIGHO2_12_44_12]|uniref:Glycosyltransferase 2-like domain-containing protein n=5 Tax=Candidatus Giovannoniibacteriota TaxID=1752738 RepID=A0A1F5X0A2_9BACT|nr:MAG: hypothetical protein A2W57_02425 [Candidatus Giovannonibacteria bacterium RIFCSPHIGHO2_02_43_16]OGF81327.1 MAG: hypothetical protein A2W48_00870 [Candidatus Giovannonibacteria bacterium RIFCSPHIGHO2_12_44_12]
MNTNQENKKLVSIGMATRNHAPSIKYALNSLLSQTYPNFELIILDGASTDDTQKICEEFAEKDNRVRYIRKETNGGFINDFGNVLKEGKGEYFMWAADDDWWHPTFVEKMVHALENSKKHDVAMSHFSERRTFEYNPESVTNIFEHNYTNANNFDVYKKMIKAKVNPIFFHGLYRREALNKLYRRMIPNCIDGFTIFNCEAALATNFYSVPEVLYSKYKNPEPITARHEFIKKTYEAGFPQTKYLLTMLSWLLTSPNIPIYRKPFIIPPWLKLAYKNKRKIVNEFV